MNDLQSVLLIHAAVVKAGTLNIFARRLTALGFTVHNIGYPNRHLDFFGCAEYLLPIFREIAEAAPGQVHLAGHSLGGLVIRRLLHLHRPENQGRVVTLGTPHLGSPLADRWQERAFYRRLFGPVGRDLVTGRPIDWLAPWPPPYDIGLIAGSIPLGPGSFLLKHPSDGTVPKASAQPPGGADYAMVPATHTTIPFLPRTARLAARFFRTGRFT